MSSRTTAASFDAAYFKRFYGARATRVYGKEQVSHLARGVTEMIAWLGGDLKSVLDVGAGAGLWKQWFARHRPDVSYRSTDVSAYACDRFGHERRDIATWRVGPRDRFDLVVCQGVLPYLDDVACKRAIANLGAMTKGFLYLEAITARDLDDLCDRTKTDVTVHPRSGTFYRRELAKHFVTLGCGLHYAKSGALGFYELEQR